MDIVYKGTKQKIKEECAVVSLDKHDMLYVMCGGNRVTIEYHETGWLIKHCRNIQTMATSPDLDFLSAGQHLDLEEEMYAQQH